jgi:serine protease AprX
MEFTRERLEELMYGGQMAQRFTQDSPVLPDVWFEFAQKGGPIDLLLTPYQTSASSQTTPGVLSRVLRDRLAEEQGGYAESKDSGRTVKALRSGRIAYNQSNVLARVTFNELVRVILPMSSWWADNFSQTRLIEELRDPNQKERERANELLVKALNDPGPVPRGTPSENYLKIDREMKDAIRELRGTLEARPDRPKALRLSEALWMLRVIGTIALLRRESSGTKTAGARPKARTDGASARGKKPTAPPTAPPEARPPELEKDFKEHRKARQQFFQDVVDAFLEVTRGLVIPAPGSGSYLVHTVSLNRPASVSVIRSRMTVKADAAATVFAPNCEKIAWAVVDSGIDATHPAFRIRKRLKDVKPPDPAAEPDPAQRHLYHDEPFDAEGRLQSRITETYDFTQIQSLMSVEETGDADNLPERYRPAYRAYKIAIQRREQAGGIDADDGLGDQDPLVELRRSLQAGRDVDWRLLLPFIRVHHVKEATEGLAPYQPPVHEHGTHVAGILGGDWGSRVQGVCPDIRLIDLRVLDEQGHGDEFSVIAALQFIRYLRSHRDYATIQGVNLSISIRHDVTNYACGRTPVCEECERLVGSGMVVVAAAGNEGYQKQKYMLPEGVQSIEAYRTMSITDPGNAQSVITVGSTHRHQPHTYGVSYFSSRGPTGDGRSKPDLVAPGEKIEAPVPGDTERARRMDGTSMATPHVSGAAALLIARHRELAGQPERIKQILCRTATDLGRERYFQGAGMVDILRALQSV